MRWSRRASNSACSSAISARETLISTAEGFIAASCAAPIRPRVLSVSGQAMATKSACLSISSRRSGGSTASAGAPGGAGAGVDCDHAHAQRLGPRRDRPADAAEADQAQGLPGDFAMRRAGAVDGGPGLRRERGAQRVERDRPVQQSPSARTRRSAPRARTRCRPRRSAAARRSRSRPARHPAPAPAARATAVRAGGESERHHDIGRSAIGLNAASPAASAGTSTISCGNPKCRDSRSR